MPQSIEREKEMGGFWIYPVDYGDFDCIFYFSK